MKSLHTSYFRKLSLRLNNRGVSLIEMMIVLATISITLAMSGGLTLQIFTMQKKIDIYGNLVDIQKQFIRAIKDDVAWQNTVNSVFYNGAAFACLRTGLQGSCSSIASPVQFTLLDAAGLPVANYDQTASASNGFDLQGQPCTSYSTGAPTQICPLRVEMTWMPRCSSATGSDCAMPEIEITFQLMGSFPTTSPYATTNVSQFEFSFTRTTDQVGERNFACTGLSVARGVLTDGDPNCRAAASFPGFQGSTYINSGTQGIWVFQGKITCAPNSSPPPACPYAIPSEGTTAGNVNSAHRTQHYPPCTRGTPANPNECWTPAPGSYGVACAASLGQSAYMHYVCL